MDRATAAILDGDRFARMALRTLLRDKAKLDVLWDCPDLATAQRLMSQSDGLPQLLILGMHLGDGDGVSACKSIRLSHANLCILGVTAFHPNTYAADLAAAGAQGLASKESDAEILFGVKTVLGGGTYCPRMPLVKFLTPAKAFAFLNAHRIPPDSALRRNDTLLTQRECEVLAIYERTGSYNLTASELGIAASTVRNIMHQIRKRLGAPSTAAALIIWHALCRENNLGERNAS